MVPRFEEIYQPYSQRQEWSDVKPIHVATDNPTVSIQYQERHKESLAYLRAVLASGELSERVLQLTSDVIEFNQADYTAWQLRWLCVEALNSSLRDEQDLTENIMRDNAKNYQLWNHRRKCALKQGMSAASLELEFSASALDIDEKNYHAWSHRTALVEAFGLWEQELAFVDIMLSKDIRNNSAWNQRMRAVRHLLQRSFSQLEMENQGKSEPSSSLDKAKRQLLDKAIEGEIAYASKLIVCAPRNESAWNYLLGLFSKVGGLPGRERHEAARWIEQVRSLCCAVLVDTPSCAPALAVLAEVYFIAAQAAADVMKAAGVDEKEEAREACQSALSSARKLFEGLCTADPIRGNFYKSRKSALCLVPGSG